MDEKQRAVLERNRSLLVGNIVHTHHFFQLLKSEHVLTDTMIRDVQVNVVYIFSKVSLFKTTQYNDRSTVKTTQ